MRSVDGEAEYLVYKGGDNGSVIGGVEFLRGVYTPLRIMGKILACRQINWHIQYAEPFPAGYQTKRGGTDEDPHVLMGCP